MPLFGEPTHSMAFLRPLSWGFSSRVRASPPWHSMSGEPKESGAKRGPRLKVPSDRRRSSAEESLEHAAVTVVAELSPLPDAEAPSPPAVGHRY
jgi:hypothetical protein